MRAKEPMWAKGKGLSEEQSQAQCVTFRISVKKHREKTEGVVGQRPMLLSLMCVCACVVDSGLHIKDVRVHQGLAI